MREAQKEIVSKKIVMLEIKDVMELTGWGEATVRNMFAHDEEFPAIKKGKSYQVSLNGLNDYLMKRRVDSE